MTQRFHPVRLLILPLCVALAGACGGDSVAAPEPVVTLPARVLSNLRVTPGSADFFPEDTIRLTISAWDQFGVPILERFSGEWADKTTYMSNAPQIATVNGRGLLMGVAPGTAEITAMLTLAGVTQTASVTATVLREPPDSATVTANQNGGWAPLTVYVKAGGTVTWVIPDGVQILPIWLYISGKDELLEFINGRAVRTFSTPGTFPYSDYSGLMWDEGGHGLVKVH